MKPQIRHLSSVGLATVLTMASWQSVFAISTSGSGSLGFTNPFGGDCFFAYTLGSVTGTIDDGGGQDQFRVVMTDANNVVIQNQSANPGPLNIGPFANRTQSFGNTNPTFSVGGWFLDPTTVQFPITVEIQERSGGSTITGTVRTDTITLSDFQNAGSSCFPSNQAPTANAGADQQNVIPGSLVTLDGTLSSDPDGDSLTYMWTQVSGPSVTLVNPTSSTPSFTAPGGGGTVTFQLVVNDGTVSSVADAITISIQDNVAVTTQAISDFMSGRQGLILASQPDIQRRIDKLQGRTGQQMSLSGAGGTMSGDMGNGLSIWGEAQLSDFDLGQGAGDFNVYHLGGDMLLGDQVLFGVMASFDKIDFDSNMTTGVLDGNGWMAGPYVTARLDDQIFIDARVAYGKSDNTVSPFGTYQDKFDTTRYLVSGAVTGEFDMGEQWMIRPEAGVTYLTEKSESYVDTPGSTIPSMTRDQGRIHLGPRIQYLLQSDDNLLIRPFLDVQGVLSFGDNIDQVLGANTRLRAEGGVDMLVDGFRLSAAYFSEGIGANGFDFDGFKLSGGFTF